MYSYFSHGEFVSFIMSWLAWLSCVAAAPSEVQATLQYMSQYYPWLTATTNSTALSSEGLMLAGILLFLFSYLNIVGVKTLIRYNNYLAGWKVIIPLATALIIFTHSFEWQNFSSETFVPYGYQSIFEALSTVVIFSYLGFRESTSLAGETKNPTRSIPISVIGSVIICMIIYTFIQVAYIGAIPHAALANGWGKIAIINNNAPIASLATSIGIAWLAILVATDSIITPSGTALVYTATTSRLLFAMSKSKNIPKLFGSLNSFGVPLNAIFFNFIIGMILFYPLSDWEKLVKFQSNAIVMAYAVGPISLISLRQQVKDIARPFKVPVYRLWSVITFTVCNLMIYWNGWETNQFLILCLLLGVMIFVVLSYQNKTLHTVKHGLWLLPHFAIMLMISYFGQVGGGTGMIPAGVDILIIVLTSCLVVWLSYHNALSSEESTKNINNVTHALYGDDTI